MAVLNNTKIYGKLDVTNGIISSGITSSGSIIYLNENSNFDINIGTGTSTGTINIGNGNGANQNINIGSVIGTRPVSIDGTVQINTAGNSTGITYIGTSNTSGAIFVGTGTGTQSLSIGTGAGEKTVTIGSTNTTSATTINSGSNGITVNGVATFNNIPAFNGGTTAVSAPFTVDSTYLVSNLNADLLDGRHVSTFGDAIPALGGANTWAAAQTFRAANAIRSEAAVDQDAIIIAGRAGGTTGRASTITTAELGASRICTIPDPGADASFVMTEGAQTVNGVKTFGSFPVTPQDAPSTDYQVANKKYVVDYVAGVGAVSLGGNNVFTGTGTFQNTFTVANDLAQTVDLGTGAGAKTITIGSTNTTSSVTINAGSGAVNIASGTSTGAIGIGTGATTQSISIGNGAGDKTITIGNNTASTTINITSVDGTWALGTAAITCGAITASGAAISLNNNSNFAVDIATGTSTGTVGIGTGNTTQAINIGSGATGTKTINIGYTGRGTTYIYGNAGAITMGSSVEIAAGSFNATSKRELKENIVDFTEDALSIINGTKIVRFNFKEDEAKKERVGFIADDTDKLLAGPKNDVMDIYNSVGVLLKAVQELSKKNEELEKRVAILEAKL